MGASMCGHVLKAGHTVLVHNRTRARAEPLIDEGASWEDSLGELAAGADIVFLMVGYPQDVRSVVLGPDGLLAAMRPGSTLVDMTSSDPELASEIARAGEGQGVDALDAPVSGGDVGAKAGTLTIMVGGSGAGFERARPLLELMGSPVHMGPAGSGQRTKVMNQIAIASGMLSVCEALLYAREAGLDVAQALEVISKGAAGSWSLSNYAPRMLGGDFAPGFKIRHFIKDLGIALSEARRMDLKLPGTELALSLYEAAEA